MAAVSSLSRNARAAIGRGMCSRTTPSILAYSIASASRYRCYSQLVRRQPHLSKTLPLTSSSTPTKLQSRLWTRYSATASAPTSASPVVGAIDQGRNDYADAVYTPPTKGILSKLPASWVPYAELIRLDKPTGGLYLFYPCLWSTLLASTMLPVTPDPASVLYTTFLFASGALIMRSAGCTINDFWDRNFDKHVSRTRFRPIARGAITPKQAFVFATAQCLLGFGVLVQFPLEAILWGIPSLALVCTYPLAKRITHYPQVVLGAAFSWGAILGFPAVGASFLDPSLPNVATAAACLYASNVAWTVLYDIIYAHQDLRDDIKAGVKGIVVKHPEITKPIMAGLAVLQTGLLAGAGYAAGVGPVYYAWSCLGGAAANGWMIWRANLRNEKECWEWFKWNSWMVGAVMVGGGLTAEYMLRLFGAKEKLETAEAKE